MHAFLRPISLYSVHHSSSTSLTFMRARAVKKLIASIRAAQLATFSVTIYFSSCNKVLVTVVATELRFLCNVQLVLVTIAP